jgi:hypothetical protein
MWITNYIALIGWIIITVILFLRMPPQKAIIISVLGSFLFLPMSRIPLHFFSLSINKTTAVGFGIFFGEFLSGVKAKYPLHNKLFDLPNILFCFVVPLVSSLLNGLGLYDGISGDIGTVFSWGIFFWAGRRYFGEPSSMRTLTKSLIIGGLLYVPFILYESRMGPVLTLQVYGFFAQSLSTQIRYGHYRPLVFMYHGLVVALWMALTTIISFWLWRTKGVTKIGRLPAALVCGVLAVSTALCRSSNSIVYLVLGIAAFFLFNRNHSPKSLKWFLIIIPIYMILRLSGVLNPSSIEKTIGKIFDTERTGSFMYRIWQEYSFGKRALLHPLFGWGRMGRAWPIDLISGEADIAAIDSFWIMTLGIYGLLGLVSTYLAIGLGPWRVLAASGRHDGHTANMPFVIDAVVLSLIVAIALIDSLMNSGPSPFIILCAGALLSYHQKSVEARRMEQSESAI